MALKHSRAFLWRGEDLGAGYGSVKERIFQADVAASGSPTVFASSFVGSTAQLTAQFPSTYTPSLVGLNRIIVNQNSRYFMTFSGYLGSVSNPISFPIAPLQAIFLPANIVGPTATLTSDSQFPLVLPPGVSGPYPFIAGSSVQLAFDYVAEV